MSTFRSLALASCLVLAPELVTGSFARGHALPPPSPTLVPLPVFQSHGFATRSKAPCGYRLVVRGAPGTRYEVEATPLDGEPELVGSGTIPAGGILTTAIYAPGCPPEAHTVKVAITSRSDARIRVVLEYF